MCNLFFSFLSQNICCRYLKELIPKCLFKLMGKKTIINVRSTMSHTLDCGNFRKFNKIYVFLSFFSPVKEPGKSIFLLLE